MVPPTKQEQVEKGLPVFSRETEGVSDSFQECGYLFFPAWLTCRRAGEALKEHPRPPRARARGSPCLCDLVLSVWSEGWDVGLEGCYSEGSV